MQPNPYASPADQSDQIGQRTPLLIPQAYIASLFALYCILPFALQEGGIIDEPWEWPILIRLLALDTVLTAFLGIAAFTMLARANGKPLRLGRGACVAHLLVAGLTLAMLPELRIRSAIPMFLWSGRLPLIVVYLTFAEFSLLHFAIRRFEKHFGLACVTVAMTIIVALSVITIVESGHLLEWEFGRYFELVRRSVLIGGPGSICLLLGLRLVQAAHDRRNDEQGKCGQRP